MPNLAALTGVPFVRELVLLHYDGMKGDKMKGDGIKGDGLKGISLAVEEVTKAFKRHQMSGIDISGVRWGVPADIAYFALHGPQDQLQKLFALKDVIGLKGVDLKSPEKIGGASITYSMKGSPKEVQKNLAASVPYEISDRFFTSRKVEVHVTWVVRDRDLEAAKEAVRQAYSQYCTFVKQRKQFRIKPASDLLQARNWPVLAAVESITASITGASSIGSLPAKFNNLNSLNNDHQDLVPASGTGSSSTLAPAPNTGSSSPSTIAPNTGSSSPSTIALSSTIAPAPNTGSSSPSTIALSSTIAPASNTGSSSPSTIALSSTIASATSTGSSSSVGSFPVELTHQGTRKRELSQETQLKNMKAGKARRVSWGVNEIRFYEKGEDPEAEVEHLETKAADLRAEVRDCKADASQFRSDAEFLEERAKVFSERAEKLEEEAKRMKSCLATEKPEQRRLLKSQTGLDESKDELEKEELEKDESEDDELEEDELEEDELEEDELEEDELEDDDV